MTKKTKTQSTPKPPREDDKYDVWRRDYIEPFYSDFERQLRVDNIRTSELPDELVTIFASQSVNRDEFVGMFLSFGNDYLQRIIIPVEMDNVRDISVLLNMICQTELHRRTHSLKADPLFESFFLMAFNYRLHPYLKKLLPFSWVMRTYFKDAGFNFILSNDYVDPEVAFREYVLTEETQARQHKVDASTTEASPEPQAQGV